MLLIVLTINTCAFTANNCQKIFCVASPPLSVAGLVLNNRALRQKLIITVIGHLFPTLHDRWRRKRFVRSSRYLFVTWRIINPVSCLPGSCLSLCIVHMSLSRDSPLSSPLSSQAALCHHGCVSRSVSSAAVDTQRHAAFRDPSY